MDDETHLSRSAACPYVNENDPRCTSRFALSRMQQAFTVCFGSFHACPMYRQIRIDRDRQSQAASALSAPVPLINVTAHGQPIPLRATGS